MNPENNENLERMREIQNRYKSELKMLRDEIKAAEMKATQQQTNETPVEKKH